MPTSSFRTVVTTPATPSAAWTAMQRPEVWEGIAGVDHVTRPTFGPDGSLTGFQMSATVAGTAYPGTADVVESTAPESMRLHLSTSELSASIHITLAPVEDATSVTVEVEIRSRTWLSTMFFPALAGTIGRGLPAAAAGFAERLGAAT